MSWSWPARSGSRPWVWECVWVYVGWVCHVPVSSLRNDGIVISLQNNMSSAWYYIDSTCTHYQPSTLTFKSNYLVQIHLSKLHDQNWFWLLTLYSNVRHQYNDIKLQDTTLKWKRTTQPYRGKNWFEEKHEMSIILSH